MRKLPDKRSAGTPGKKPPPPIWIGEVEALRLAAERTLAHARREPLSAAAIKELVGDAKRVVHTLAKADATLKAELYGTLGVRATYLPTSNEVELVAAPVACATGRVGGGT